MKRRYFILLVIVMLVMTFVACAKFSCDLCGEEKTGKSHESSVLGEEVVICDECYQELHEIFGDN